jgi:hypothetical protein
VVAGANAASCPFIMALYCATPALKSYLSYLKRDIRFPGALRGDAMRAECAQAIAPIMTKRAVGLGDRPGRPLNAVAGKPDYWSIKDLQKALLQAISLTAALFDSTAPASSAYSGQNLPAGSNSARAAAMPPADVRASAD